MPPPLYRIKKGKSEKYIKDDKEFTREILRRATENLAVQLAPEGKEPPAQLEGSELRAFLMQLDEFDQISRRLVRRVRVPLVAEVLSDVELVIDNKTDWQNEKNVKADRDGDSGGWHRAERKRNGSHRLGGAGAWNVSLLL